MNGRAARALRQWAIEATGGVVPRKLVIKNAAAPIAGANGVRITPTGTLVNENSTTRAVYPKMKRGRA